MLRKKRQFPLIFENVVYKKFPKLSKHNIIETNILFNKHYPVPEGDRELVKPLHHITYSNTSDF